MNILVVDDEKIQTETLKRVLRGKGYQVFEAQSAKEAIECLNKRAYPIDMVITDYLMPDHDGIELLKEIRHEHGELPVIIMTAYGEKNMLVEALRNRVDGFLEKPFDGKQLIDEINRVMENKR